MLMFTGTTIQDQTWFVNRYFRKSLESFVATKAQAVGAWVELTGYRTLVMATIRPVRDCIRLAYLVAISSVSNILPRLNHTLYRLFLSSIIFLALLKCFVVLPNPSRSAWFREKLAFHKRELQLVRRPST